MKNPNIEARAVAITSSKEDEGFVYLEQVLDSIHFYTHLNPQDAALLPEREMMRASFLAKQTAVARTDCAPWIEAITRLGTKHVLHAPQSAAHSCHSFSHAFRETWRRACDDALPLHVTAGNVYYKGRSLYPCTRDSIKKILLTGRDPGSPVDMHVWLTFDDLTVIDVTLLSTLAAQGLREQATDAAPILVWRADAPGDFLFEPLLIDNDLFAKIDTGIVTVA